MVWAFVAGRNSLPSKVLMSPPRYNRQPLHFWSTQIQKLTMSPENVTVSKGNVHLPTIFFEGPAVSFSEYTLPEMFWRRSFRFISRFRPIFRFILASFRECTSPTIFLYQLPKSWGTSEFPSHRHGGVHWRSSSKSAMASEAGAQGVFGQHTPENTCKMSQITFFSVEDKSASDFVSIEMEGTCQKHPKNELQKNF